MKKNRWVQSLTEDVLRQIQLENLPSESQCSGSDGIYKAEGRYIVPLFSKDKNLVKLDALLKDSRMSK